MSKWGRHGEKTMTDSVVLGHPDVSDDGLVRFPFHLRGVSATADVSPLGIGVSDEVPLDIANAALLAVDDYWQAHKSEMLERFRQAAKLRREAGREPPIIPAASADTVVMLPPTQKVQGTVFTVLVGEVGIDVHLLKSGCILDHCEDWTTVTERMRITAWAAVLNILLSTSEVASTWGIDIELYRDLWT